MAEALLFPLGLTAVLLALAALAAGLDAVLVEGPAAWRAPWQETARLARQRRRALASADRLLWRLGGAGLLVAALLMAAVVPVGGRPVADVPVGVVWFNAMDVVVWAAVWCLGWGANAVHGLVGGYRFLAQALSYELPLMFALTAPAVAAASLRMTDVAAAQADRWFVVEMPVAFLVFCVGVVGFSVHGPFAHPAGADVHGGVLAELSGVDRWVVQAGRYALLAAGAAFGAALFLGGGTGPWLPGWVWSLVTTLALLAVLVAGRRLLPVVRPDRFVEAGWLVLLPLTLAQVFVVSVVAVLRAGGA
ncbi:NADH-quinone oxidoreductase subunit H [Aquipuribacter nitratireducens]|uniref:NADH-quinone oxidoreductase subunit H n=1 Tax=Aquipuribacter nitratireducens TaxID=650104 RepID=A0ABW0GNW3_9MICO